MDRIPRIDAPPNHLTLESLTIKHPDSDAKISLFSSRSVTGIWIESSADGAPSGLSAAMYVQQDGSVVMQLANPGVPHFRASQLAFSMGRDNVPTIQVVTPAGQVRSISLGDVVDHVARDVVPEPQ